MSAIGISVTRSRSAVLAGMIFAVAMTFIDQTIVSIAAPNIQRELALTNTGVQWAINAYLISLAAFFALGGRLADTVGHRRMVTLGVVVFAGASVLCGLTPTGGAAEAWLICFRAVQGLGGALLFPAALGIVVQTFALHRRGRALALFFGIAGGLTAVGPVLGGYLTEWTWRAIFWVNVPVALVALALIALSHPETEHRAAPIDVWGVVLITGGVALSVCGFQESASWGWQNPATALCIAAGCALLVGFVALERRTPAPLMPVRLFLVRAFAVENLVLFLAMLVFVPVFFFASEYAEVALGKSAGDAGLYLLYFFLGFALASQIGGRALDRRGAKRPVTLGCACAAGGLFWWAHEVTTLSFSTQIWPVILAGAGMGLMLTPASTDAVNRAPRLAYGEATGIAQTVRNYAAGLGLAVLGTIFVTELRARVTTTLLARGVPAGRAPAEASRIAEARGAGTTGVIPHVIRLDVAFASRTVFEVMAAIMVVATAVALVGLVPGVQEDVPDAEPIRTQTSTRESVYEH